VTEPIPMTDTHLADVQLLGTTLGIDHGQVDCHQEGIDRWIDNHPSIEVN